MLRRIDEQDWEANQSYLLGVAWRRDGRELRLMLQRFDGLS
ncbi:MAG: hypothetical protein ACREVE_02415 [Gammaproteobacteria bacterium]